MLIAHAMLVQNFLMILKVYDFLILNVLMDLLMVLLGVQNVCVSEVNEMVV